MVCCYAGWTALHEACNHGHPQLADLLLTAGAFVNALGSDDYTPLHDAAVNGHREVSFHTSNFRPQVRSNSHPAPVSNIYGN